MTIQMIRIAEDLLRQAAMAGRIIVAIAGPPGAGKSTFAEQLAEALRASGNSAAIVPMDGFHMDDAVLREKGLLSRKGAPQTFDLRGLLDIVRALRSGQEEVLVPLFDRDRELAIAAARPVPPQVRFVLIEGNYLLLDEPDWTTLAGLIDRSIMLLPSEDVLERRLMRRWLDLGLDEDTARSKVAENDLPNGRLVRTRSRKADLTID